MTKKGFEIVQNQIKTFGEIEEHLRTDLGLLSIVDQKLKNEVTDKMVSILNLQIEAIDKMDPKADDLEMIETFNGMLELMVKLELLTHAKMAIYLADYEKKKAEEELAS